MPMTAFKNGAEPGGQSTGVVSQSDEKAAGPAENAATRPMASRRICARSPRFDPRAMNAARFQSQSNCESERITPLAWS